MRRRYGYAWGPIVLGLYVFLALVATFLLVPLCVRSPGVVRILV